MRERKVVHIPLSNGHSYKQCFQQMEKSEKYKNGKQEKWCSLHNSTSHPKKKRYQQKSGSKCKDSFTAVDGRNSKTT